MSYKFWRWVSEVIPRKTLFFFPKTNTTQTSDQQVLYIRMLKKLNESKSRSEYIVQINYPNGGDIFFTEVNYMLSQLEIVN
jgi:hypothetical protein